MYFSGSCCTRTGEAYSFCEALILVVSEHCYWPARYMLRMRLWGCGQGYHGMSTLSGSGHNDFLFSKEFYFILFCFCFCTIGSIKVYWHNWGVRREGRSYFWEEIKELEGRNRLSMSG